MEEKEARMCRLEYQRKEIRPRFFGRISTDSHEHVREHPEPGTRATRRNLAERSLGLTQG